MWLVVEKDGSKHLIPVCWCPLGRGESVLKSVLILIAVLFVPLRVTGADSVRARVMAPVTCVTSQCHSQLGRLEFVHGPVKSQGCHLCHLVLDPKASPHPKLEKLAPSEVNRRCFVCHDELPGKLGKLRVVHGAIEKETCLGCHDPHQSARSRLLKADPRSSLCLGCHQQMEGSLTAGTRHRIRDWKEGCRTCHAAHGSDHAKILQEAPTSRLCLSCHQEARTSVDGRTIQPIKIWFSAGKTQHEPVRKGECQQCHQVHGSEAPRLLKDEYSEQAYGLCLNCHKKEMISHRRAQEETAFRNGETNLHYLHLVGGRKQRSCQVCHEVHASDQPKLIRATFFYKQNELPIRYRKTPTGGSCVSACHREMKYDRERALENEPTIR